MVDLRLRQKGGFTSPLLFYHDISPWYSDNIVLFIGLYKIIRINYSEFHIMPDHDVLFAFLLTLLAGLATGVGSLMSLFSKKFNPRFLAGSLGFSAGVMIYVSFVEIFQKGKDSISSVYGNQIG